MRSFATAAKQFWTVGALGLVLVVGGACSDDDGHNHADATVVPTPDGAVDATIPIDGPLAPSRTGLIGVLQVSVANFGGAVSGAGVSVSVRDARDSRETGSVIYANGTVTDGCTVRQYDPSATPEIEPNPSLNEGAISISGDINPTPFPDCVYDATREGYICPHTPSGIGQLAVGDSVDHTAVSASVYFTDITIAGATFDMAGQSEVGMIISVSGFPVVDAAGGAITDINNGKFGIIGVLSATTVRVINTTWAYCLSIGQCDGAAQDDTAIAVGGGFGVVAGAAPIPGAFQLFKSRAGLCTDGTTACTVRTAAADCTGQSPDTCTIDTTPIELTIEKKTAPTGDEVVPMFSETLKPSGEGMQLTTASVQPEAMPTTTGNGDLTVGCKDATDGDCGIPGEFITGLVINAQTTNAAVADPSVNAADFPDATGLYTTLFCAKIGLDTTTIPEAAWAAFLAPGVGGNPGQVQTYTRFETQILRLGAKTAPIGGHGILRGAGYGIVGYTDAPAP